MTVHRIDMDPLTSEGETPCRFMGEIIVTTATGAIYDCARWLLDHGASPDDTIQTYWNGTPSMSGQVGRCALWTVQEDDYGMRLVRWRSKLREPVEVDLAA